MKSRIDLTFNLSWQSEVLLRILQNSIECHCLEDWEKATTLEDLDDLRIETFPLYNCRERGICLVVDVYAGRPSPTLLIFFAEHRNTDSLFVWCEETEKSFMNGPTINDFGEESYKYRDMFGDDFIRAADFICERIGAFYKKHAEEVAA